MPKVLGWSKSLFFPNKLGNLCKKKEWWIESVESEHKEPLERIIISGSDIENHRAKNIKRGFVFSGARFSEMIGALAADRTIVAVVEDATIEHIPTKAQGVEWYPSVRIKQAQNAFAARWQMLCKNQADIETALEAGAQVFLINPQERTVEEKEVWQPSFPSNFGEVSAPPYTSEYLCSAIYRLLGARSVPNDLSRYLGDAFWDIAEEAEAIIVLHADQHGDCLGMLSKKSQQIEETLEQFCQERHIVLLPFVIPPMIARWDRAIRDYWKAWEGDEQNFPISGFQRKSEENEEMTEDEGTEEESVESNSDMSEDEE